MAAREIHLTFDSGLRRELILTPSDKISRKVARGAQPGLVADYDLMLDGEVVVVSARELSA